MFNLHIDWKSRSLTFPLSPSTTNVHHLQTILENSSKEPLLDSRKPKMQKPLFVGARAFMHAAKTGSMFFVYANPLSESTRTTIVAPEQYQEFQDIFNKKNADILPEHRPYDCSIDLQDGAQPPFGPIYNLSQNELSALREYLDENLAKNFIKHSKSPAGAPVLFVKKKDGSLQISVDYFR